MQLTFYSPFVLQTVVLSPPSVKGEHLEEMRRCGMPKTAYMVIPWVKNTGAPYFQGFTGIDEGTIIANLTDQQRAELESSEKDKKKESIEKAMKCCVNACVVMDEIQDTINAAPNLLKKVTGNSSFQAQLAVKSISPTQATDVEKETYFHYIRQLCTIMVRSYLAVYVDSTDGLYDSKDTLFAAIPPQNNTYNSDLMLSGEIIQGGVIQWLRNTQEAEKVRGFLEWFVFTRPAARAWSSKAPRQLFVDILNRVVDGLLNAKGLAPSLTTEECEGFQIRKGIEALFPRKMSNDVGTENILKQVVAVFTESQYGQEQLYDTSTPVYQLACFLCYQILFSEPAEKKGRKIRTDEDSDDDIDPDDADANDAPDAAADAAAGAGEGPIRPQELEPFGKRTFGPLYFTNRLPTLAFLWASECTIGATATLFRKAATDPITLLGFFGGVPEILNATYGPSEVERVALYSGGSAVSMYQSDPFAITMANEEQASIQGVVKEARSNLSVRNWLWPTSGSAEEVEQEPVWESYNMGQTLEGEDGLSLFGMACSRPAIKFTMKALRGILSDNMFMTQDFMTSNRATNNPLNVVFAFPVSYGVEIANCRFVSEFIEGEEWRVCVSIETGKAQEVMGKLPEILTGDRMLGFFIRYRSGSTVLDTMFDNMPATMRTTYYKQYKETLVPTRVRFLSSDTSALSKVPARIGGGIINVTLPLQTPTQYVASSGAQPVDYFTQLKTRTYGRERKDYQNLYRNRGFKYTPSTALPDPSNTLSSVTYSDVQEQDMAVWGQTLYENGESIRDRTGPNYKPTTKFITMAYIAVSTCAKTNTVYRLGPDALKRSDKTLIVGTCVMPDQTSLPGEDNQTVSVVPSSDYYIGNLQSEVSYVSKPNALVSIQWNDAIHAAVNGLTMLPNSKGGGLNGFDMSDPSIKQWLGQNGLTKFFTRDNDMFKVKYRNEFTNQPTKTTLKMTRFKFDASNYVWTELVSLVKDCEYQSMEVVDRTVRVICSKIAYTTQYAQDTDWTSEAPRQNSYWMKEMGDIYTYYSAYNEKAFSLKLMARPAGPVESMKRGRGKETSDSNGKQKKQKTVGARASTRSNPGATYLAFPFCPFSEFLVLTPVEGKKYQYEAVPNTGPGNESGIAARIDTLFKVMQWPYGCPTTKNSAEYKHCGLNGDNCYVASAIELRDAGEKLHLTLDQCWKIWIMLMNHAALGIGVASAPVLTGTNYKGISCSVRIAPSDSPLTDRQWDGRIWRYGSQQFRGGTWDRTSQSMPKLVPRVAQFLLCASRFAPPKMDDDADIDMAQTLLLNSTVVNMNRQIEASAASSSRSHAELMSVKRLVECLALMKQAPLSPSIITITINRMAVVVRKAVSSRQSAENYTAAYLLKEAFNSLYGNRDAIALDLDQQYSLVVFLYHAFQWMVRALAATPVTAATNLTLAKLKSDLPTSQRAYEIPQKSAYDQKYKNALSFVIAAGYAKVATERHNTENVQKQARGKGKKGKKQNPDLDDMETDIETLDESTSYTGKPVGENTMTAHKDQMKKRADKWKAQLADLHATVKSILGDEFSLAASWTSRYNTWVETDNTQESAKRDSSGESICMPFIGEPLITRISEELGYSASTEDDSQPHVLDFLSTLTPPTHSIDLLAKNMMTRDLYDSYTWGQLMPLTIKARFAGDDDPRRWMRGEFDRDKVSSKGSGLNKVYTINGTVTKFYGTEVDGKVKRDPESMMLFYQKCKLARRHEEWSDRLDGFDEDFTTRMLRSRISMLMAKEKGARDEKSDVLPLSTDLQRISAIQAALYEMVVKSEWFRYKVPALYNAKTQRWESIEYETYHFNIDITPSLLPRTLTESLPVLADKTEKSGSKEVSAAIIVTTQTEGLSKVEKKSAKVRDVQKDTELRKQFLEDVEDLETIKANLATTDASHAQYYTFEGLKREYLAVVGPRLLPERVESVRYKELDLTIGTLKNSDVTTESLLEVERTGDVVSGLSQFYSTSNNKMLMFRWAATLAGDGNWELRRKLDKTDKQYSIDSPYMLGVNMRDFINYESEGSIQAVRNAWFVMAVINDLYDFTSAYHNDFRKVTYGYTRIKQKEEIIDNGVDMPFPGNRFLPAQIAEAASACFTKYLSRTQPTQEKTVKAAYETYRGIANQTLIKDSPTEIWGGKPSAYEFFHLCRIQREDGDEDAPFKFFFPYKWDGTEDQICKKDKALAKCRLPAYNEKYANSQYLKDVQFGKKTTLNYPFQDPDDILWQSMQSMFGWTTTNALDRQWQRIITDDDCELYKASSRARLFPKPSNKAKILPKRTMSEEEEERIEPPVSPQLGPPRSQKEAIEEVILIEDDEDDDDDDYPLPPAEIEEGEGSGVSANVIHVGAPRRTRLEILKEKLSKAEEAKKYVDPENEIANRDIDRNIDLFSLEIKIIETPKDPQVSQWREKVTEIKDDIRLEEVLTEQQDVQQALDQAQSTGNTDLIQKAQRKLDILSLESDILLRKDFLRTSKDEDAKTEFKQELEGMEQKFKDLKDKEKKANADARAKAKAAKDAEAIAKAAKAEAKAAEDKANAEAKAAEAKAKQEKEEAEKARRADDYTMHPLITRLFLACNYANVNEYHNFPWFKNRLLAFAAYNPIFREAVNKADNGVAPAPCVIEGQRLPAEGSTMGAIDAVIPRQDEKALKNFLNVDGELSKSFEPFMKLGESIEMQKPGDNYQNAYDRGIIEAAVNLMNLELIIDFGPDGSSRYLPRMDLLLKPALISQAPLPVTLECRVDIETGRYSWQELRIPQASIVPRELPEHINKRKIPIAAMEKRRRVTHQNQARLLPKLETFVAAFSQMKAHGINKWAKTSELESLLRRSFDDVIDAIEAVRSTHVSQSVSSLGKLYGDKNAILQGVTFENADMRRLSIVIRKRNDEVLISKKLAVCSRDAAQNPLVQNIAYETAKGYERTVSKPVYKMMRTGAYFINTLADRYGATRDAITRDMALRPSITSICAPDTTFRLETDANAWVTFSVEQRKRSPEEMISNSKAMIADALGNVMWKAFIEQRLIDSSSQIQPSRVKWDNTIMDAYQGVVETVKSYSLQDTQACQLRILSGIILKLVPKLQYKSQSEHKLYDFILEYTVKLINQTVTVELETNEIVVPGPPRLNSDDADGSDEEDMEIDDVNKDQDWLPTAPVGARQKRSRNSDGDSSSDEDSGDDAMVEDSSDEEDSGDEEDYVTETARTRGAADKDRKRFVGFFEHPDHRDLQHNVSSVLEVYLTEYLGKVDMASLDPELQRIAYHWCSFCRKLRGLLQTNDDQKRQRIMLMTACLSRFYTKPWDTDCNNMALGKAVHRIFNCLQTITHYDAFDMDGQRAKNKRRALLLDAYLLDHSVFYGGGRDKIVQFAAMWWCVNRITFFSTEKKAEREALVNQILELELPQMDEVLSPGMDVDLEALQKHAIDQNVHLGHIMAMTPREMVIAFGFQGSVQDDPAAPVAWGHFPFIEKRNAMV